MTDQQGGSMASHRRPTPRVRRLEGKEEIRTLLETERLYAAYPIAELDNAPSGQREWFVVEDADEMSLCQLYKETHPNLLFMVGSEAGIAVILGSALRPPYVTFTCEPRHLPVLQAHYRVGEPEIMVRMVVSKSRFKPAEGEVIALAARDLDELKALYTLGGLDVVTAADLSQGIYRGVRLSGELVSVAGTHVVSPAGSIAAVGNVFTHPKHRNQGFATICTSAVTAELLRNCRDVVLNTDADNGAAIRTYAKLGYREHCRFMRVTGVRKGTAHLSAFADRLRNR